MKLRVYMMMECSSSNQWSLAGAWVIASITVLLMVCCGLFFSQSRLVSSRMALLESPAYGTSQPALPPAMDLPKRSTEVCTHNSTHPKVPPKSAGVLHLTTTAVTCCCYACISPNKKIENIICTFYYIIQLAEINWQTSLDFPIVLNYIVQCSQEINKERSSHRRNVQMCLTWSLQALWCLLKITAAPRLRAGLIPVPVMGMVAKCTK